MAVRLDDLASLPGLTRRIADCNRARNFHCSLPIEARCDFYDTWAATLIIGVIAGVLPALDPSATPLHGPNTSQTIVRIQ